MITETEDLEESEKNLQSAERFELQKESQKTIKDDMSAGAGASVTAKYGVVSVSANADYAVKESASESNRHASSFAKEITERSVANIRSRARRERTRRTLEKFEEKNEHGFDNKDGAGHVIGVYRWVDKYYKARLVNYGRRLMLEFTVPEPAAFYRHLESTRVPADGIGPKPKRPTASGRPLKPEDLNKLNYSEFIAEYNVHDVEPYPAEVVRVGVAFAESLEHRAAYAKVTEKLRIPDGYTCERVYGVKGSHYYSYPTVQIAGKRWSVYDGGQLGTSGLEGTVPISVLGSFAAISLNLVAVCTIKPEAVAEWQIQTYQAIMNGYEQRLADYHERAAMAEMQAGVNIQGRNPEMNRAIEREELKKGVLRLLTDDFARVRVRGTPRYNEKFDAMQPDGEYGYPEFNVREALVEGRIIQFFEQAFEWDSMTYRFYPYSWGRKSGWKDVFPLSDADPLFTDFLRSGAARVIVPAHPAYTEAVLHYLATDEIWGGGNPPTLDDPMHISIVDELRSEAAAGGPGGDPGGPGGGGPSPELPVCSADSGCPCIVDEWEVKVPTSLVYLQEDSRLPDHRD